jgi:peptide/nickel transport system substrate-binding protein
MKFSTGQLIKRSWHALMVVMVGCANGGQETAVTVLPPTPTTAILPTAGAPAAGSDRDFIVVATDAPIPNFTDFDKFGNVIGFDNDLMARLSAVADFEYEFVVTPHEGVLESLATRSNKDFDAVMSALVIPTLPEEGIAYTTPYLEVGQVLMVLADNREMASYLDIRPGMSIGVEANSGGEQVALDSAAFAGATLRDYENSVLLLQALVDGLVDAAVVDSYTAEHFAQAFPGQLKIVGGAGRATWISSKAYGIAVADDNVELLDRLNQAILQAKNDLTIERLTVAWFIPPESINAGESRVPTPASEIIIGMVGNPGSMDPASDPDFIGWELKINTMSGLYRMDSDNQLAPMLVADPPSISEDKLEYTFSLRQGVRFPDGSELTAEDVRWAVNRSAGLGSFLVNEYLRDADGDRFADDDAIQVVDTYTVKFLLQEPAGHFLSLLATPPYFPISDECYAEAVDVTSTCGGIGPYTIANWETDGILLKANPEWPGRPAPAFENIRIRFFDDADILMRAMVDFRSIDAAWTGLSFAHLAELGSMDVDGDGNADFESWEGPAIFKSYLMFDQATPPWDSRSVRQAAALALDRATLASAISSGDRRPLFSPVPDLIPGHLAVFPERNLEQSRALLLQEGYGPNNPLAITLSYTNDAHYTPDEEVYANAIKAQLEETGVFQVSLQGAPWEVYRPQIGQCGYPLFLLGWPTPGQPASHFDMSSWTDFFVKETSGGFCSNYESEAMEALVTEAGAALDPNIRLGLYAQIQQLWAEDLLTLDLTQEMRRAVTLSKVDNVRIDAMGLLHYEVLTKGGG